MAATSCCRKTLPPLRSGIRPSRTGNFRSSRPRTSWKLSKPDVPFGKAFKAGVADQNGARFRHQASGLDVAKQAPVCPDDDGGLRMDVGHQFPFNFDGANL